MTLYELQEKYPSSLQCGKKALQITQKLSGAESTPVANVLVRLGQLCFIIEGPGESLCIDYIESVQVCVCAHVCVCVCERGRGQVDSEVILLNGLLFCRICAR